MTREEKCRLAIEKGYTYNPETGKMYGPRREEIIGKIKSGYIQIKLWIDNKKYNLFAHQFAWYLVHRECVKQIDHINGIRDDNRICNLRAVTNQQNSFNRTKAKGYSWDKARNKWVTQIHINGKKIYLGRFDSEEDARTAYLQAKEIYHII